VFSFGSQMIFSIYIYQSPLHNQNKYVCSFQLFRPTLVYLQKILTTGLSLHKVTEQVSYLNINDITYVNTLARNIIKQNLGTLKYSIFQI
jgi:hypothetical protein